MILHNAPPTHSQTLAIAAAIPAIVVFALAMTWWFILAHRLDQTEEDA